MSFKLLTDNQILALAIDEWLMELNDKDWEEALRHIEMRKRQRAKRKNGQPESQEVRSKAGKSSITSRNMRNSL